jgi:amino acid transporter
VEEKVVVGSGYKQELSRDLTVGMLVMFGLLCMFPFAPTQVWASAQVLSQGHATLVYLICGCAMLFTALSYKWMSSEFPVAGSSYSYVQRAMHASIGFLAGWLILMDYSIIPGMLVKFSTTWLAAIAPNFPAWIVILLFTLIITVVVARGGNIWKWVNYTFLYGQLAMIALFAVLAAKAVLVDGVGLGAFSLKPFFNADTFSFHAIAQGCSVGLLGFIGFDSIATQSEEAKKAAKSVGKAVLLSLVCIVCIFMTQSYFASLVHPDYTTLSPDMGYFDVMKIVGGHGFYTTVIGACVLFVGIANAIPVLSAISRVLFAMGRDNAIPFSGFFKQVNEKTKTPVNATVFVGVLSIFIAFLLSLETLSRLVNFGAMSTYFLLNVSVIWYFVIKKKQYDLKSLLIYGLFPAIGAGIIAYVFTGFDHLTWVIGLIWLVLGIVVLLARRKHFSSAVPVIEEV